MGEPYMFPAQMDRCALCYGALDLRDNGIVVKGRALPWIFCSRECFRTYHGKDSGQAPSDPSVKR